MDERRALTVKGIEAAAAGAELRDGAAPGLCIRINAGSRVFRWYLTREGRAITIGRWSKLPREGYVTLTEARTWLERLKDGDRTGRLADVETELAKLGARRAAPSTEADAPDGTVRSVAGDFMKFIERERKRPENVKRPLDCDILPALGARRIATVTPQDCRKVIEAVVARGSTRQAGVVLQVLKQLFNFAAARGDVTSNPALVFQSGHAIGVTNNVRQRFLSPEEIAAFWRALDGYHGLTPTVRAGLKLLLLTGVRTGSLLQARMAELDLEARTWTIPPAHLKLTRAQERNARPFVVPLAPTALALFQQLAELAKSLRSEHVMASFHAVSPGEPVTEKSLNAAMRRLFVGRAPLLKFDGERPTPHDLRRTMRTYLGDKLNVPFHVAERALGHSLGKMAATYDVADYISERRTALERWDEYVRGLVEPELKNVVMLKPAARSR